MSLNERAVNRLLREMLSTAGRLDPYPSYARLVEYGPVSRSSAGWTVVSGYAECLEVLRDATFRTTSEARKSGGDVVTESGFSSSLLGTDGPQHRQQRRPLAAEFTTRATEALRPLVVAATERAVSDFVEALDRDGAADLMEHVASTVPTAVIGDWACVPEADWPMLRRTAGAAHMLMEMGLPASRARAAFAAFAEVRDYFDGLVAGVGDRRDVLWPWARTFPDTWLSSNLALIMAAGTITTSGLIGSMVLALSTYPDAADALLADAGLAGAVAVETARFDGPAQVSCRVPDRDTTIAGVPTRAGTPVVLLLGAANRDERVWKEPAVFDIHREEGAQSLTFGHGRHRCLGATVAIMQMAEVLSALTTRVGRLRVVECRQRGMLSARGPERLVVERAGS